MEDQPDKKKAFSKPARERDIRRNKSTGSWLWSPPKSTKAFLVSELERELVDRSWSSFNEVEVLIFLTSNTVLCSMSLPRRRRERGAGKCKPWGATHQSFVFNNRHRKRKSTHRKTLAQQKVPKQPLLFSDLNFHRRIRRQISPLKSSRRRRKPEPYPEIEQTRLMERQKYAVFSQLIGLWFQRSDHCFLLFRTQKMHIFEENLTETTLLRRISHNSGRKWPASKPKKKDRRKPQLYIHSHRSSNQSIDTEFELCSFTRVEQKVLWLGVKKITNHLFLQ